MWREMNHLLFKQGEQLLALSRVVTPLMTSINGTRTTELSLSAVVTVAAGSATHSLWGKRKEEALDGETP